MVDGQAIVGIGVAVPAVGIAATAAGLVSVGMVSTIVSAVGGGNTPRPAVYSSCKSLPSCLGHPASVILGGVTLLGIQGPYLAISPKWQPAPQHYPARGNTHQLLPGHCPARGSMHPDPIQQGTTCARLLSGKGQHAPRSYPKGGGGNLHPDLI